MDHWWVLKISFFALFCHPSQRKEHVKTTETHPNDSWVVSKMADRLSLIPRSSPLSKCTLGDSMIYRIVRRTYLAMQYDFMLPEKLTVICALKNMKKATRDEARSPSFWHVVSNETIRNYEVTCFLWYCIVSTGNISLKYNKCVISVENLLVFYSPFSHRP